jgi:hypothetical protein
VAVHAHAGRRFARAAPWAVDMNRGGFGRVGLNLHELSRVRFASGQGPGGCARFACRRASPPAAACEGGCMLPSITAAVHTTATTTTTPRTLSRCGLGRAPSSSSRPRTPGEAPATFNRRTFCTTRAARDTPALPARWLRPQ